MAKQKADEAEFGSEDSSEPVSVQFPATESSVMLTPNNAKKLDAAQNWLERLFLMAQCQQIDGRKFHGWVEVRVKIEAGVAVFIGSGLYCQDRVVRDGM